MAVQVKETKLMLKSVFADNSSGVMKREEQLLLRALILRLLRTIYMIFLMVLAL